MLSTSASKLANWCATQRSFAKALGVDQQVGVEGGAHLGLCLQLDQSCPSRLSSTPACSLATWACSRTYLPTFSCSCSGD
jgi:hypothetical protein